ncbi:MAG: glycosyltransferase family 4 protein [Sphingomonas bacterium]
MPDHKPTRIFYIAAAGDLVAAYKSWKSGTDFQSETAKTYSGSIFEFARKYGMEGTFLSPSQVKDAIADDGFCVKNVRIASGGSGLGYYINWMRSSMSFLWAVLRNKPDVALISNNMIFLPMLFFARMFGIKIINIMHVAFYSPVRPPVGTKRLLSILDSIFLKHGSNYILGVSQDIVTQSHVLCGRKAPPGAAFTPQWNREKFDAIFDRHPSGDRFSLTFIGRMERDKGIFDLLQAFASLHDKGHRLKLDFLGDGGARNELRTEIARRGLSDFVTVHGHCSGDEVIEALARTHLVVVPTRSEFVEGLNKVAIEAVLGGRPVVTSRVCQSSRLIEEAMFEATPDDWRSYAQCIERAMTDPAAYNQAVAAARVIRERFFDPSRSIGHMLERAFADLGLIKAA